MTKTIKCWAIWVAAVLVGAGCATNEGDLELPLNDLPEFSAAGEGTVAERWWTAFGNQDLNRLMEEALSANFTLKAAWARMNAAGAIARRSGSDLYPDLDARGRAETVGAGVAGTPAHGG